MNSDHVTGFVIGAAIAAVAGYILLSKSICLFGSCAVFG